MINPIIVIITAALILSVIVVSVINKPKKPIITGTMIIILACYLVLTFLIDNSITSFSAGSSTDSFICFLVMNDTPTYNQLAESFNAYMKTDIILIASTLLSLFIEIMLILKKKSN